MRKISKSSLFKAPLKLKLQSTILNSQWYWLTAKRRLQKNVKYFTHVKPPDAIILQWVKVLLRYSLAALFELLAKRSLAKFKIDCPGQRRQLINKMFGPHTFGSKLRVTQNSNQCSDYDNHEIRKQKHRGPPVLTYIDCPFRWQCCSVS